MNRDPQRLPDYLGHILEAIENILSYTDGMSEAGFMEEGLTRDAVMRNLQIIGEASRNIAQRFPDFVASHPDLDLSDAWLMRNRITHGYFNVDYSVVWKTIQEDLPPFHQRVKQILKQELA